MKLLRNIAFILVSFITLVIGAAFDDDADEKLISYLSNLNDSILFEKSIKEISDEQKRYIGFPILGCLVRKRKFDHARILIECGCVEEWYLLHSHIPNNNLLEDPFEITPEYIKSIINVIGCSPEKAVQASETKRAEDKKIARRFDLLEDAVKFVGDDLLDRKLNEYWDSNFRKAKKIVADEKERRALIALKAGEIVANEANLPSEINEIIIGYLTKPNRKNKHV